MIILDYSVIDVLWVGIDVMWVVIGVLMGEWDFEYEI
jgi:hypothetical protein